MGHWQALALSWVLSVLLVGIGYVLWSWFNGEPVQWGYLGFAALLGGGGAMLLMVWRGLRGLVAKDADGDGRSEGGDE